jgi:hypothetical protein
VNHYEFVPSLKEVATFDGLASPSALEKEVGVYAADLGFIRTHCGPLAQSFIDAVPQEYYREAKKSGLVPNCDIRLHYLKAGQYPAAPGWHCDAATRETSFDAKAPGIAITNNLVGTISSSAYGVSNTEFALDSLTIDSEYDYGNDPQLWKEVDDALNESAPRTLTTEDGVLYGFDPYTLHRAAPAKTLGWRLFFRMSLWVPPPGHLPGIATSEQVYNLVAAEL